MDAASLNPRLLRYNGTCQDPEISGRVRKKIVCDPTPKHTPYQMQTESVHNIPPSSFAPHALISSTVGTPPISSVYLEQGEYFFDDEFAEPMDPHLQEDRDDNTRYPLMVQSMDCSRKPPPDLIGHSRSDSCIFSPVNSRESGLSDSKIAGNHFANNINHERLSNCRNAQLPNNIESNILQKNANESKNLCLKKGFVYQASNETSEVDFNNDASQQFTSESQGSVHYNASGSTSWMHMLMERSCNPELRALINRTAAAVDYKLAYGDSIGLQGRLEDRSCLSSKHNVSGLVTGSRSLSQGSLLAAASLAGLRHALDQTTQLLPKPTDRNTELCSVGVSADLISDTVTMEHKNQDSSTSNTTTWAKKHGSRESLKRRSLRSTEMTVFPYPNSSKENEIDSDHTTTWQTIKDANGALITWNQLKRVVKRAESLGKSSSVRESRRDHHNQSDPFTPKMNMTGSVKSRSHSQPLAGASHMHRFSGTLFEIFMHARAQGIASLGVHSDCSAVDLNDFPKGNSASAYSNPAHIIHQEDSDRADILSNRYNYPLGVAMSPRISGARKSYLFAGTDPRRSSTENDKYLLLRKERIFPSKGNIQFSPLYTSADAVARSMRNFGAQFPPLDDSKNVSSRGLFNDQRKNGNNQNTSPIWSTKLPLRNGSSAAYANNCTVRHSHPQPLYLSRPMSALHCHINPKRNERNNIQQSPSPIEPPTIAACLTASAGPDSPYMAALRAGCAARGYAVGWIGNPRASIAYPGLGLLSVPRPSRLAGSAFLSHTLPDLSFLSQAGAEEDRKGTPTMTKRRASCLSTTQSKKKCTCTKCGCRSTSAGRVSSKGTCSDKSSKLQTSKIQSDQNKTLCRNFKDNEQRNTPDIISTISRPNSNDVNTRTEIQTTTQSRLHCPESIERCSSSEPDLVNSSISSSKVNQPMYGSVDSNSSWIGATSTTRRSNEHQNNDCNNNKNASEMDESLSLNSRPKKSVSFSGNIRLLQLNSKDSHHHYSDTSTQQSPEPKVIPRNWGLYGQEQPLAEFNPRCSPSLDSEKNGKSTHHSDIDVRYHAMVNDVIKAVQETVAYYCNPNINLKNHEELNGHNSLSNTSLPYSKVEAIGSSGKQPLLAVIPPLTILLCDGLLPPSKPIFTSRPRTRLWQLVEESCRPGALPTGVAYHVLNDAISQVKALTNITLEKTKFKGFICACLNAKALPMWLNALVANDTLLRRFYCENAFIRQCRASQRELHADLMTHLEQLLAFPFNLDISIEVRKPFIDSQLLNNNLTKTSIPSTYMTTNSKHLNQSNHGIESTAVTNNKTGRSNIPPATVVTRRQMIFNGNSANSNNSSRIPSVSSPIQTTTLSSIKSSNTTTSSSLSSNNHCYPQHHLPNQRSIPSRLPSASKSNPRSNGDNNSEANSVCLSTETGLIHPRTTNSENQINSQAVVRSGRFKNAFSNLRRSNGGSGGGSHVSKSNTRTLLNTPSNSSILNNSNNNGKLNNISQMTESQRRTTTTTTAATSRQLEVGKANPTKSQLQKLKPSSNSNISTGGGSSGNVGHH